MISPSWSFAVVLALNCLQNSMMLTPCGPSAGPTGCAGVALPAGIWSFTMPVTFLAKLVHLSFRLAENRTSKFETRPCRTSQDLLAFCYLRISTFYARTHFACAGDCRSEASVERKSYHRDKNLAYRIDGKAQTFQRVRSQNFVVTRLGKDHIVATHVAVYLDEDRGNVAFDQPAFDGTKSHPSARPDPEGSQAGAGYPTVAGPSIHQGFNFFRPRRLSGIPDCQFYRK